MTEIKSTPQHKQAERENRRDRMSGAPGTIHSAMTGFTERLIRIDDTDLIETQQPEPGTEEIIGSLRRFFDTLTNDIRILSKKNSSTPTVPPGLIQNLSQLNYKLDQSIVLIQQEPEKSSALKASIMKLSAILTDLSQNKIDIFQSLNISTEVFSTLSAQV